MTGTQRGVAAIVYLSGLFGFGLYDLVARANWDLFDALGYGAQWPITVFQLI